MRTMGVSQMVSRYVKSSSSSCACWHVQLGGWVGVSGCAPSSTQRAARGERTSARARKSGTRAKHAHVHAAQALSPDAHTGTWAALAALVLAPFWYCAERRRGRRAQRREGSGGGAVAAQRVESAGGRAGGRARQRARRHAADRWRRRGGRWPERLRHAVRRPEKKRSAPENRSRMRAVLYSVRKTAKEPLKCRLAQYSF